jgi:RNA polymerase sigma factor (sigma-70 family)
VGVREAADDELLAACLRGEAAGWEALLDRYAPLMYSIPLKFGLEEADAADVFQSVCLTLLEHLATIRAPGGLAAWLITTTRRQCLAVARRRRRDQAQSVAELASADEAVLMDPEDLPEEELLALERQRLVRAAVSKLTGNCRRIIEALFSDTTDELSYRELANGLGVPVNSLGPTRARCLERLRRLLVSSGYVP